MMNYPMYTAPYEIFNTLPSRLFSSLCIVGVALLAQPSDAKAAHSAELMATYGRGVHAYFSGRVFEADRLFTEALEGGSTDPRVYYFRALARMCAGLTPEAEGDVFVGASIEARKPGYRSLVNQSLVRVQGSDRHLIEEYRRRARLDHLGDLHSKNRSRYERLKRREPKVLRKEVEIPMERLTAPGSEGAENPVPDVKPPAETKEPEPAISSEPVVEDDQSADPIVEDEFEADAGFEDDDFATEEMDSPVETSPAEDETEDNSEDDSFPF